MLPTQPAISHQNTNPILHNQNKPHYLGFFVCNILGDRAYLYLNEGNLEAKIYNAKREVICLSGSLIQGGRERNMPLNQLIQLVTTVASPFLFASYQPNGKLQIFARDFQEIQKNQFLKPRINLPHKFFECVKREHILNGLKKILQKKQTVVLFNDPTVPLKRVGKTEIALDYFEEYGKEYAHVFWIHASDPWYFKQDIEKMANSLQIPADQISEWLSNNTNYLIVLDGVEENLEIPKGKFNLKATTISDGSSFFKEKAGRFSSKEIAQYFWLDSEVLISDDMLQKVNKVAIYLKEQGFELAGIKADGNCFCNAFLESYKASSHFIPVLDAQKNPLSYLRGVIAKEYEIIQNRNEMMSMSRIEEIKEDGECLTADEGDLLAKALDIPIRIVTVNLDQDGCGISDMVTFSEREKDRQKWKKVLKKPERYILIVDLGGHFVYAKPSSPKKIEDSLETSSFEAVQKYIPQWPKGHILITSRDLISDYDPLKVGLLSQKEGITFLLTNAKGTEQEAKRVAQSLGYVPSSLYRALETIEVEELKLSNYLTYCQTLLDKHADMAKTTSNLPLRNKDFVGRETGLVALEESFSKNKPVVLAANAGLGGIGKTQIAIQYAYRTCPNYNLTWWINCGNMHLSYDDLAQRLGIQLTEEERKEQNAVIKRVNLYLERTPGWLLIFDNAEDEKSLDGLLPRSGGHILITSRHSTWNKTQVEVFGIEVFKREESIDLILQVTSLYDQETQADELAEQLQDLPLAIAQAAAYIRETGISIQKYIEDFKRVHMALWKREQTTNNYQFTINVTWNLSIQKIQEKEKEEGVVPQAIALPLMEICSFFAPNDIPREALLLEWLKVEYGKNQNDTTGCLANLNRTLSLLANFSMIKLSEATISVHSLVQTVVRDCLSNQRQQQEVFGQALSILTFQLKQFIEKSDKAMWSQSKLCVPHGMSLFQIQELMVTTDLQDQYRFMSLLGNICGIFGNSQQVLKIYENCLKIAFIWYEKNPEFKKAKKRWLQVIIIWVLAILSLVNITRL